MALSCACVTAVAAAEPCASATPSVQHLATIDNAEDGTFQCIGLSFADGRPAAILLETHAASAAQKVTIQVFLRAELESSRGAVLDGVPGHDAIILRGSLSVPAKDKFVMETRFLYNGFTGEYHSCPVTIRQLPGVGWRLVDRLDRPISRIVVRTRDIPLFGMFGIANLDGACI